MAKTSVTTTRTSEDAPLDLKGSEQHFDLKNKPGEKGDPDHADTSAAPSDKTSKAVDDADEGDKTAIGSALKDATD